MKHLHLTALQKDFDKLQLTYGDPSLDPIVGAGRLDKPKLFLMFMNPTARNVASAKPWKGIKGPWIGTKNVWKMLAELNLFDYNLSEVIQEMKPDDWTEEFAEEIYNEVASKDIYISNLAKCTQLDARPLPNTVFKQYLQILDNEIDAIKPRVIITFGNQVSSVFLKRHISVSQVRKQKFSKEINRSAFATYSLYYPVGQGRRNMPLAQEDLKYILQKHN